jgi:hypothetical protein
MNPLEDSEPDTIFDYCLLTRLMLHLEHLYHRGSKSFRRHAMFRYKLAQASSGPAQIHDYVVDSIIEVMVHEGSVRAITITPLTRYTVWLPWKI